MQNIIESDSNIEPAIVHLANLSQSNDSIHTVKEEGVTIQDEQGQGEEEDAYSDAPSEYLELRDVRNELGSCLDGVRKAHAWFSHGALVDPVNPGLTLQKNGTVGLPLSVHGARRIFEESLVDGKGSTYKIDAADVACRLEAEQFDLKNPSWAKYIDGVRQQVVKGLSIRNARMELQGLSLCCVTQTAQVQEKYPSFMCHIMPG